MAFSLFPKTLYKGESKISGPIEVSQWLGKKTLSVQNMIQSGGMVEVIWKKPIKTIKNQEFRIKNVLILGLGGGTVVGLINKFWPKAKIVGVELDPEIIKVANKYFLMDKFKNLRIINSDAIDWIGHCDTSMYRSKNRYDLVVVDLYLGKEFPQKATGENFMKNVQRISSKNGYAAFNRLKTDETEGFQKQMENIFSKVEVVKTATNHFFLARS